MNRSKSRSDDWEIHTKRFCLCRQLCRRLYRQFKETPLWKNTVIVLVPDHLGAYPQDIDNLTVDRYRIPLIFIGGAVKEPRQIGTYGSQIDIAATLLGQLGLPHEEFIFSKNMLNPNSPHFGFFTFPNAFGMMTPENVGRIQLRIELHRLR